MLDIATYTPALAGLSIRKVTGQAIARASWDRRERARLAAHWKLGRIQIDPTTKLAASVFSVPVPLVVAAIRKIDPTTARPAKANGTKANIDAIFVNMTVAERDAFVHRHLLQVWDAIDRVTA